MSTFLSIDVDFWNYVDEGNVLDFLNHITTMCALKGIPITAVMNHHQMLKIVSQSTARKLLNIDAHSDLEDSKCDTFNCGTWISYVTWRKEGEYTWLTTPNQKIYGDCAYTPIFRLRSIDKKKSDWKNIERSISRSEPSILNVMKDVVEVCVCMSPSYSDPPQIEAFNMWVKQNNIPYKKGVIREWDWSIRNRTVGYYDALFSLKSI